MALLNRGFAVEASEFFFTAILMAAGFVAFYFFATSKNKISKQEGMVLVTIYGVFVVVQVINFIRFATD